MRTIPDNYRVEESLDILMGKWKPIILLHLIYNGTQRFSELKKLMLAVTQKMLTKLYYRIWKEFRTYFSNDA